MTDLVVANLMPIVVWQLKLQQAVVTKFGALGANADVLFGDYIAEAAKGSKEQRKDHLFIGETWLMKMSTLTAT